MALRPAASGFDSLPCATANRTTTCAAAASSAVRAPIEALPTHTPFIELKQGNSDRPDLQIVSGDCGVGSKENFEIITPSPTESVPP